MKLEGGCFCGAVRYEFGGDYDVTHCHCLHCRKLGGAAYVTWVEAEHSKFSWTRGRPAEFESRPGAARTHCADCGSPLTFQNHELHDSIDVTAGTLDDPSALVPKDHVWFDRHLRWAPVEDGLPRFKRGRRDEEGQA